MLSRKSSMKGRLGKGGLIYDAFAPDFLRNLKIYSALNVEPVFEAWEDNTKIFNFIPFYYFL